MLLLSSPSSHLLTTLTCVVLPQRICVTRVMSRSCSAIWKGKEADNVNRSTVPENSLEIGYSVIIPLPAYEIVDNLNWICFHLISHQNSRNRYWLHKTMTPTLSLHFALLSFPTMISSLLCISEASLSFSRCRPETLWLLQLTAAQYKHNGNGMGWHDPSGLNQEKVFAHSTKLSHCYCWALSRPLQFRAHPFVESNKRRPLIKFSTWHREFALSYLPSCQPCLIILIVVSDCSTLGSAFMGSVFAVQICPYKQKNLISEIFLYMEGYLGQQYFAQITGITLYQMPI